MTVTDTKERFCFANTRGTWWNVDERAGWKCCLKCCSTVFHWPSMMGSTDDNIWRKLNHDSITTRLDSERIGLVGLLVFVVYCLFVAIATASAGTARASTTAATTSTVIDSINDSDKNSSKSSNNWP